MAKLVRNSRPQHRSFPVPVATLMSRGPTTKMNDAAKLMAMNGQSGVAYIRCKSSPKLTRTRWTKLAISDAAFARFVQACLMGCCAHHARSERPTWTEFLPQCQQKRLPHSVLRGYDDSAGPVRWRSIVHPTLLVCQPIGEVEQALV